MARQADSSGLMFGAVFAPAIGAAIAVFGLLVHYQATEPEAATLTLGELMPRAADIWISSLAFAYPSLIVFFLFATVLNGMGFGGRGGMGLSGAIAGLAGMSGYLYRVYGANALDELAGGPIGDLTLSQLAGPLALPAIGAGAGLLAGLIFAGFNRRR